MPAIPSPTPMKLPIGHHHPLDHHQHANARRPVQRSPPDAQFLDALGNRHEQGVGYGIDEARIMISETAEVTASTVAVHVLGGSALSLTSIVGDTLEKRRLDVTPPLRAQADTRRTCWRGTGRSAEKLLKSFNRATATFWLKTESGTEIPVMRNGSYWIWISSPTFLPSASATVRPMPLRGRQSGSHPVPVEQAPGNCPAASR